MRILGPALAIVAVAASCRGPQHVGAADSAQSVSEQRRDALVAHWLENARKLRAVDELAAAKLELLKAINLDRHNGEVAAELEAIRQAMGEPRSSRVWVDGNGGAMPLRGIHDDRARALVAHRLQQANALSVAGDHDAALEELRFAESAINLENDIHWRDIPARLKKVRELVRERRSR